MRTKTKHLWPTVVVVAALLVAACSTSDTEPLAQPEPSAIALSGEAEPTPNSHVYLSGTSHIETNRATWPDPDAYLDFLERVTDAGFRWSVGADVGWLEGESRAEEVIRESSAFGVQWDIHVHDATDRARAAADIEALGGTPTTVFSGFLVGELDEFTEPATASGTTWDLEVLWGASLCPGHRAGCDEGSFGVWSPSGAEAFSTHDPNATLVYVGGGSHDLTDARWLVDAVGSGEITAPVVSYAVMVAPSTLLVTSSGEDIEDLEAFADEVRDLPHVVFATIAETAEAWVVAGRVPSRGQPS